MSTALAQLGTEDSAAEVLSAPPSPVPAARSTCEASACIASLRAEASEPILAAAQLRWAARPLTERLQIFRAARHRIAAQPALFARAISSDLARSEADTLVAELLPLLDAIRFLERNARRLLAPQRFGSRHRPLWLTGVAAEIHRAPLGHVAVIGPANFPLFLPGVQSIQALVAGNAVTWKPGRGGQRVAALLAHVLRESGLPRGVLHIAEESVEAAQAVLAQPPDKVVFTGSAAAARHILATLAQTATPSTMELSGADAVLVLPTADLAVVAKAVAFGLRLNGAEVCMSPRRLVATRETLHALRPLLAAELAKVPAVPLKPTTAATLRQLLEEAVAAGAVPVPLSAAAEPNGESIPTPAQPLVAAEPPLPTPLPHTGEPGSRPLLLDRATPAMAITRADLFAPVLSLLEAPSVLHMAAHVNDNPYGLTAAIFGDPAAARTLAAELRVGTVLINDLIAPTADPRVPFGGRGASGFGTTRGAEGLLEMTTSKTLLVRQKGSTRHYDPLSKQDLPLFSALIGALHAGTPKQRWHSVKQLIAAARSRSAAR